MFTLSSNNRFHLYSQPTDMRKSFNGLSGLVENELERTPLSGEVFLFINKRRDKIKLLHWGAGGYTLYYKQLEFVYIRAAFFLFVLFFFRSLLLPLFFFFFPSMPSEGFALLRIV